MLLDKKRQKMRLVCENTRPLEREKETELHSAMGFSRKALSSPPKKNRRKMSTPAALLLPPPHNGPPPNPTQPH